MIREFPGVLFCERSFVVSPPEEEKRPQENSDSEGQKDHIPQHFLTPQRPHGRARENRGVYK